MSSEIESPDAPPPAVGCRLPWEAVPGVLRASVANLLGAAVLDAATQAGGFSPGVAVRLRLADGSRAFVKAVGPEPNPDSPDIHRSEARIAAALPASAPAPRLLGTFDEQGWVVLVFEDVEGTNPRQPWDEQELQRVLDAVTGLAGELTPSPIEAPTVRMRFADQFQGWRRIHATPLEDRPPSDVESWARRHLADLAALEAGWSDAVGGGTLTHSDLRADNLLLTDERVVVVDWPWASIGAPWFDLLGMLPSVRMQGGPDPERVIRSHPLTANVDPDAISAVLAALSGFFLWTAAQPDPPGLPTVRRFQRAQGLVALDWLRGRLGWG